MVERKRPANNKRSTRGATRSANTRPGLPASLMFGAGFFSGIVATVLVIAALEKNGGERPTVASAPAKQEKAEPPATRTTTKFDFFTVLPEREVIVPDENPRIRTAKPAENTQSTSPQQNAQQTAEKYILQAGSFRSFNDADRRRAQIILLGLDAKVESVDANGDRWHRVYVGPFQSHNTLSSARSTLISEGIDTLVIRQKG